jgi:hypothetical protein
MLVVNFGPDVTPEVAEAASEQIAAMVEAQRAEIIEQEHARLRELVKALDWTKGTRTPWGDDISLDDVLNLLKP